MNSCYLPSWVDTFCLGRDEGGPLRPEQPLVEKKTRAMGRKRWIYRNAGHLSTTRTNSGPKTALLMIPGLNNKFALLEGSIGKKVIDWNKARLSSPDIWLVGSVLVMCPVPTSHIRSI